VLISLGSDDECGNVVFAAVLKNFGVDLGETLGGTGLDLVAV